MAHRCDGRTTFQNEITAIGALRELSAMAKARNSAPIYVGWYQCVWCQRWHLSRFERNATRPTLAK